MNVTIGKKDYELRFGFAALDYLDHEYTIETQGYTFGQGLQIGVAYLLDHNPLALRAFIKAGTETEKSKPSNDEIEQFLMAKGDEGTLPALFDEVLGELKKQPLTKDRLRQVTVAMKK